MQVEHQLAGRRLLDCEWSTCPYAAWRRGTYSGNTQMGIGVKIHRAPICFCFGWIESRGRVLLLLVVLLFSTRTELVRRHRYPIAPSLPPCGVPPHLSLSVLVSPQLACCSLWVRHADIRDMRACGGSEAVGFSTACILCTAVCRQKTQTGATIYIHIHTYTVNQ